MPGPDTHRDAPPALLCPHCRYDVRDHVERGMLVCPECGRGFHPEACATDIWDARAQRSVQLLAIAMSIAGVTVGSGADALIDVQRDVWVSGMIVFGALTLLALPFAVASTLFLRRAARRLGAAHLRDVRWVVTIIGGGASVVGFATGWLIAWATL